MSKEPSQRGFGLVGAIVIILTLGLISFGAWFVWSKNRPTSDPTSKTTSTKSDVEEKTLPKEISWQTYRHDEGGFTFQYPDSWNNRDEQLRSPHAGQEQDFWGVDGEITAPSGNLVEWHYRLVGGKGGDCEPNADDIVFERGNKCASKQILQTEGLPPVTATKPIPKNLFEHNLYITKTKYRPPGSGDISYNICLDAYSDDNAPQQHGPTMGLMFRCQFWDTGLNMTYSVKTEAGLYSDEAKIVERIMKSVKPL